MIAITIDPPQLEQPHQVEQVRRKKRNSSARSSSNRPVYAIGMLLLLSGGSDGQPPAYCEVVAVEPELLCIPVQP